MRKLIESTLVSLDGVIEAPERWATFDTEAAALSLEQLGNYGGYGASWPLRGRSSGRRRLLTRQSLGARR
jgi:hypothetical protein